MAEVLLHWLSGSLLVNFEIMFQGSYTHFIIFSYHVNYAFHGEAISSNCFDVKDLLA